jgi:hypothetical protein
MRFLLNMVSDVLTITPVVMEAHRHAHQPLHGRAFHKDPMRRRTAKLG